jgi:hypothetical protein
VVERNPPGPEDHHHQQHVAPQEVITERGLEEQMSAAFAQYLFELRELWDVLDLTEHLDSGQIAIQEVTELRETTIDTSIYRKNLQPVVYVTGDVAGGEESPAYAIMKMSDAIDKIKLPDGYAVKQYKGTTMPDRTDRLSMKWDGEWHITIEVFRDLGLAFAAVLLLIYVLVVGWFESFKTPLLIMAAIPFSLVGILPAHAAMLSLGSELHENHLTPVRPRTPATRPPARSWRAAGSGRSERSC